MTPPLVLVDASAVLAWIFGEQGAHTVERVLPYAAITSANMAEVLYRGMAAQWRHSIQGLEDSILATGLRVVAVVAEDAIVAGGLIAQSKAANKQAGSLSLGDGLCIAVAQRLGIPVTGGDQHWETLDLPVTYQPFR